MKKFNLLSIIALGLSLTLSCKKTDHTYDAVNIPSRAEFKALQHRQFDKIIQTKLFRAEDGLIFESEKGTKVTINAGCLRLDGAMVTGDVELKFAELYDRGIMAITNRTTLGRHADGSYQPLITGGSFLVEVYKEGRAVATNCGYHISVPAALTGGVDHNMTSFAGEVNEDDDLIWEYTKIHFNIGRGQASSGLLNSYEAFMDKFGWFNCDYFGQFPDPKTAVQFILPRGFTPENASVYVSIKGESNAIAPMYGNLPLGLDVHFIFVSADGDNFRYAIKTQQVVNNHLVEYNINDTQVVTPDELVDIINALD